MKRIVLLLLLATAGGGEPGAAAAASPASLVVVSDDNYPPYIFRDDQGQLQGILPDEWALWEKKTGVKVFLQAMEWTKAQQLMQAGQADVIEAVFRSPEREKIYGFTQPYAQVETVVFTHDKLGGIIDAPSLQGFTVGIVDGEPTAEILASQGVESLKRYPSYAKLVQAARNHEVYAFAADEPAATYFLYKCGAENEFRKSFTLATGELHRAASKNQPELLNLVQGGFDRISPREYRAIEQKWRGTPFRLKDTLRDGLPLLFLIAGVVSVLAVGNLILRTQVRARTAELHKALEALQQSQVRLQSIFQVAPVGVGILAQRKFLEVNDTFCHMSGYAREELIGQPTRLLYPSPEENDRVGRIFYEEIVRTGFVSTEIQGRQKNGEIQRWLLGGAPLDRAHPQDGVVFSVMDITARQKAEMELRASHEYFATVFNAINEAIFIGDAATGKLLDINQRTLEMYGFSSREEALATGLGPMCAGVPPYTEEVALGWIQKAYAGSPQVFEWMAKHRDGHFFWVEINICRVQIGSDTRMIVTARDIGDRKAAEEDRLRYERRLQETQRLESLGLLAGGIAHDFNNLLAAILGNIELARLTIPENSTAREDIQAAIAATQRAADLVQQMLAYSGKGRFLVETVDVPGVIQETLHMIQASVSKSAHLNFHLPKALPPIEADATQLRQVVMNLVINASEALENRSGTIDVSAGVVDGQDRSFARAWPNEPLPPGPYVYVEVADSGVGMPPDVLDKIFDPFFTTKFVGRGLGLPVVLGIMRGHKGAIQIDSAPGKGTRFRVLFPASAPAAQAQNPPTAIPAPHGWSGSGRLLLLVDDDQGVLETCVKLLTRLGFQVLCAVDGQHAINLFRAQAANVAGIILDLTMPNLDGAQALTELRRIRPDVPVIVSSGHSEQEVMQRFAGLDPDGFLQKPYTLDGLRNTLGHLLPA